VTSTYIGQEFRLVWLALIDIEMNIHGLLKQTAANISSIFIDIKAIVINVKIHKNT
jgi:hypothetical protein